MTVADDIDGLTGSPRITAAALRAVLHELAPAYVTPEMFGAVADLDLSDDSGTDNTAAFADLATYINTNGGKVVIDGKYRTAGGFPIYKGTWEFIGDSEIRNTSDNSGFWGKTAVFIGSYFGWNADDGVNAETSYEIGDAEVGARIIVLDTPGDADNFKVGDKIFLAGGEKYSETEYYRGSHATRVRAIDGANIEMEDPLTQALLTDGATSPTVRVLTNGLTASGTAGKPSEVRIAEGVQIVNGGFSSTGGSSFNQVVHVAAWGCDLQFRSISGGELLGCNPVVDTTITLRNGVYTRRAFELAYHHHRVHVPYFKARRGGQGDPQTAWAISEYGTAVYLGVIDISDEGWVGDNDSSGLVITARDVVADTISINGAQGFLAIIGAAEDRAQGTRIGKLILRGGTNHGLIVNSPDVWIGHIDAAEIAADKVAVEVRENCDLSYNLARLGAGPNGGAQYRIQDLNGIATNSRHGTVEGHYTQRPARRLGFLQTVGSGSEVSLEAYTVLAGTAADGQTWRLRFIANIPGASTTGSKTLKVAAGGADIATISLTSGQTGFVELDLTLIRSTSTQVDYSGTVSSVAGTTRVTGTIAVNTNTTDLELALLCNMNAADTLNRRIWSVDPIS